MEESACATAVTSLCTDEAQPTVGCDKHSARMHIIRSLARAHISAHTPIHKGHLSAHARLQEGTSTHTLLS